MFGVNLGQLTREDNPYLNKSYTYTYDNAGNRLSKTTYAYTTATSTQNYTYNSDSTWGDQLNGYTYDEIGNPSYSRLLLRHRNPTILLAEQIL